MKKLKIIGDEAFVQACQSLETTVPATLIQIEQNPVRSKNTGIDDAFKTGAEGNVVIMTALQDEIDFCNDMDWHAAISYPKTGFLRLPWTLDALQEKILELENNPHPDDPLARELFDFHQNLYVASGLAHRLQRNLQGAELEAWKDEASKAFPEIPRDDLVTEVPRQKMGEPNKKWQGRTLPGIFVDIEGTLFSQPAGLNHELIAWLRKMEKKHPITIWTGTDERGFKDFQNFFRKKNVLWKMTYKSHFFGARVEIMVDDEAPCTIYERYRITADKLH